MNIKKYIFVIIFLLLKIEAQQMIIFDLGGVLLDEAEINISKSLPVDLDIELVNGKPPRIFNRMFAFVNHLYGHDCKRDWIIGNITGRTIVQKIKDNINKKELESFFKNAQEKNLIHYGSELILLPKKLVPLTELNKKGFAFLKKCKKNNLKIGILSNWDPESFVLIKHKFKELFDLCDEIIIPADVGFIKPEIEI